MIETPTLRCICWFQANLSFPSLPSTPGSKRSSLLNSARSSASLRSASLFKPRVTEVLPLSSIFCSIFCSLSVLKVLPQQRRPGLRASLPGDEDGGTWPGAACDSAHSQHIWTVQLCEQQEAEEPLVR